VLKLHLPLIFFWLHEKKGKHEINNILKKDTPKATTDKVVDILGKGLGTMVRVSSQLEPNYFARISAQELSSRVPTHIPNMK
jgi:hypothetical protein